MSVSAAAERIERGIAGALRTGEPLARHTSFRIGGPASLHVVCDTLRDLSMVVETLSEEEVPWTVFGRGTNLLVSDSGYEGAVIVLGREFRRRDVQHDRIEAGAGCNLAGVVREAYSRGLSGLECAVGIPGTLGGAVTMNAGARDEWIGASVGSVTLLVPGEGLVRLRGSEVAWGYRSSGHLGDRGIVVEVEICVFPGDSAEIRRRMDESFRRRKTTQPLGVPSAGSVFVNPAGGSAGRLIESCGLKGRRVGGAAISEVHANFIVNEGGATARDVLELMHVARDTVKEEYGVELKTEIRFLGTFA